MSGLFLLGICYYSGFFGYLYTSASKNYTDFRSLNNLVSTQYKSILIILYVSIQMVCQMYWMRFKQWLGNNIEIIDKNTIAISYVYNGKLYKIVVHPKKGPPKVLMVFDDNRNDMTNEVLPYMGSADNWHGKEFTPAFWTSRELNFSLSSGDERTFSEHEAILLE